MISIIAAVDRRMAIGYQNKLLFWLPNDLKRFKALKEALSHCDTDEEVYIIGGESVYRQALPLADRLCLTEIDAEAPQADAYFPQVQPEIWHEKNRDAHPADEKHPCPYAFVDYVRS